jgi:hypothetical protein
MSASPFTRNPLTAGLEEIRGSWPLNPAHAFRRGRYCGRAVPRIIEETYGIGS